MRPNFSFFRIAWYVVVFKKMKMNQEGRVKTKKKILGMRIGKNLKHTQPKICICDID